jgi:flagellar FliJ protein
MQSELYIRRLTGEVKDLERDLQEKELVRLESQKKYIEASKERKVLSKLKERREEDFYKEERSRETREVDDMNNSAYVRKNADWIKED